MNDKSRIGDEPRTQSELIRSGIFEYLKDVHTALPGIIDRFDAAKQLASVRPATKRVFRSSDGEDETLKAEELPLLINVPVVFPSGNGWHLTFPVKAGDECLLIFCERTIQEWRTEGGVREPRAKRFHSLTDAIAIMGLHSQPNAISDYSTDAIELRTDGNKISIAEGLTTMTGAVKIEGTLEVTQPITAKASVAIAGPVVAASNVSVAGVLSNAGTNVGKNHSHSQPPDSDGNSQSNTGPVT